MSLRNHDWREVVKVLEKFGYHIVRQRGSHMILVNESKRMVVVPRQNSIKIGLLSAILDQARITKDDFIKQL